MLVVGVVRAVVVRSCLSLLFAAAVVAVAAAAAVVAVAAAAAAVAVAVAVVVVAVVVVLLAVAAVVVFVIAGVNSPRRCGLCVRGVVGGATTHPCPTLGPRTHTHTHTHTHSHTLARMHACNPVSYTHLTLPTIYSV